jgi:transcriptional regulator with XRE-family HTH domain
MLGIAPSALSRTLNNRREMKTEEAAKIAASLGISLDEVLRHAGIMEGAAVENTVRVMGRLNGTGRDRGIRRIT